ncbi:B3 domain-containing protein REM16 [Bienertia sinuspersici]
MNGQWTTFASLEETNLIFCKSKMVSRNCETWEEEMYWKNFHFARFTLTLPEDFHHRLMLPKKFTDHMRTQLPDKVVLKVNVLPWNIDLKKHKNDVMLHGNGWQEFAKAYSLKKSDMLIFQYDRRECFEVTLFDHASLCEKELSYFVRKGQHVQVQPNSNDSDDSSEEEFERNQGSRHRRNSNRDLKDYSLDDYDGDEGDHTSDKENSISAEDFTAPKKVSTTKAREVPSNFSRKRNYRIYRRLVADKEKSIALEKARETSTQYLNSFFVVMRPSCVYSRFYMSVPHKSRGIFSNGQEVILRVKEKTWVCTYHLNRKNGGLEGAGWKKFALENHLEEYDVCLFVPTGSKDGRSILDVSIFKVVPQAVQTSPVTPDNVIVNGILSDDRSEGDYDSDFAQRNGNKKITGGNAHNRENLCDEDELDEKSGEEKSTTDEEYTPKKAATLRASKIILKENETSYHKSSARHITEADEEQVLKMAQETSAKYENSFIASVTKDWKLRRSLRNGQEVILQLKMEKEKKWVCRFCWTEYNVGLQGGWKKFALDNRLAVSDVCLFIPVQVNNGKCILDVLIFRV